MNLNVEYRYGKRNYLFSFMCKIHNFPESKLDLLGMRSFFDVMSNQLIGPSFDFRNANLHITVSYRDERISNLYCLLLANFYHHVCKHEVILGLGYNSFHAGINPWASLLLLGTL
jgi:hypothetical protein